MQNSIDHIAEACRLAGITEVVICPGSRNAPLTIAFVRSGHFRCLSVADERSAGFIALGKAIALGKTVALLCTSGSAVVNFFPAVAEAFYQRVPLLVISADRPPELIDQWDGQTIRQEGVFGHHVKGSYTTPDRYENGGPFAALCREAIETAENGVPGPVHINVPLREPFYPVAGHRYSVDMKWEEKQSTPSKETREIPFFHNKKVMILRGHSVLGMELDTFGLPVYEDVVSGGKNAASLSEQFFMTAGSQQSPDILLTEGGPVLPKSVKNWLRQHPPKEHYHFSIQGDIADPFQTQPVLIKDALQNWTKSIAEQADIKYGTDLLQRNKMLETKHLEVIQREGWNEFYVVSQGLQSLPPEAVLHVANSMTVRYVSLCKPERLDLQVHGNRGTSGIDGCVSTALGFASVDDERPQYLFCGDIAFFYDSNAFWNPLSGTPLKVLLLNNRGGGIFRLIDGPAEQPELETYFETRHERTADLLCQNLGVTYFCAGNSNELKEGLNLLNQAEGPAVLEVFTSPEENQAFFKQYKSIFNDIKISMGNHQGV